MFVYSIRKLILLKMKKIYLRIVINKYYFSIFCACSIVVICWLPKSASRVQFPAGAFNCLFIHSSSSLIGYSALKVVSFSSEVVKFTVPFINDSLDFYFLFTFHFFVIPEFAVKTQHSAFRSKTATMTDTIS